MKPTIWEKARKLLEQKKIKFIGFGNDREFYEVGDVQVELMFDPKGSYLVCSDSCKFHGIFGGKDKGMCCYRLALIAYLVCRGK